MITVLAVAALLALGFGLGRVKHPANLKLAAVKAEVAKLEADLVSEEHGVAVKVASALAKVKAVL